MMLFILSLLSMFLYVCLDLKKSFHMLQQNWYNDGNRYLKWINNNSRFVFLWFDYLYIFSFAPYFIKFFFLYINYFYICFCE